MIKTLSMRRHVEIVVRHANVGQDGTGNGDCAHTNVSNCERDQEVVGDGAQFAVEAHSDTDQ